MPLITSIERTKKGRYALFCGEEFLFSLHPDIFAACEITAGCTVSDQRLEELRIMDEERSAKDKAMSIIARADNTSKQLYDKLHRYYGHNACALAVSRMEELGLVNDRDYAARCSRDLVNLRGWSLTRVAMELHRRGIDEDIIFDCIESFTEYDPEEKLLGLIERKYYKYLTDDKGIRRAINALMRFGYSYSHIRRALEKYYESMEE